MNPLETPELPESLRSQNPSMVDLCIVGLAGELRHVTIPIGSFTNELCRNGVGFDGSSYGFKKVTSSDMVAMPDLSSAWVDSPRDIPVLYMLSTIHLAEAGFPMFDQDSRGILERAVTALRGTGLVDEILVAPEYEFYVFDGTENEFSPVDASFRLTSRERCRPNAYHLHDPDDVYAGFRDRVVQKLVQMGMPVRYHHHEVGSPGQQEIELDLEPALCVGDHTMMLRYVLRNQAARERLRATFMPKPLADQVGTGWHTHIRMVKDGRNLFHDPTGPYTLSDLALNVIGGLLHHGPALAAFTNASTNSYRRLASGGEAPTHLAFGPGDRTAAVRIPQWAQGDQVRIEYRPSDLTGNVYLLLASLLMAALDGIERHIDPIAEGYGPGGPNSRSLPASLNESVSMLERDRDFLLRGGVFPSSVLDRWCEIKREETGLIDSLVHPYEYQLYF
jgi:glutamine synthetase